MRAFIFPGQGSQKVGMGKKLAEASGAARDVFGEVDEALSQKLSKLMFEGPADELTMTANAQPAIMAHSLAVLRTLEDGGVALEDNGRFVAGHSLGEYSALCAAGSFDLATTARLLRTRGDAMQEAVPVGEGAMAALLGANLQLAQQIAEAASQGEVCSVANDNDPGQVVLSGHVGAIDRAVELAKEMGAKRAIKLDVSAPFHSPLMRPAAVTMASALADTAIKVPSVPLYANVSAIPTAMPEEIERQLVDQVTGMVRWRESVAAMANAGVTDFIEIGGKVLGAMVKRIVPDAKVTSVVTMDDIEAFAKDL